MLLTCSDSSDVSSNLHALVLASSGARVRYNLMPRKASDQSTSEYSDSQLLHAYRTVAALSSSLSPHPASHHWRETRLKLPGKLVEACILLQ